MSVYFVASISIHDADEYGKYLAACDQVFKEFNGEYLALDEAPEILEGSWTHDRMAIICFPCEKDFSKWYSSFKYQEILRHRLAGARCDSLLVHGLGHR